MKIEQRLERLERQVARCVLALRQQRAMLSAHFTLSLGQGETIMGKIDELEDEVSGLQQSVDNLTQAVQNEATEVGAVTTELQKLREAAANGGFVDAQRFDALIGRVQNIRQNLESATTQVGALAPTPETTGEGGEGGEVLPPADGNGSQL